MNKLTRLLLASTCLTAVTSGPASAIPFSEVEPNNSLATTNTPPVGTTEIFGVGEQMTGPLDYIDFFKLSGLDPAGQFSATLARITSPSGGFFFNSQFQASNAAGTLIDSEPLGFPNQQATTVTGEIPDDGMLVLNTSGVVIEGGPVSYQITITAPLAQQVPGPATVGLLASGLAGLAGLGILKRRTRD